MQSPIILNNSPSSEQLNKTTSLFMKLFKKDSIQDPKIQVRTMHTISSTLKSYSQSDSTDDEFRVLLKVLLDDEDVYSHHKYDIGRTIEKFHITLKKDCKFQKQCPSKVP